MLFLLAMSVTLSVCTSFSGLPEGLRVEKLGRIARREEPTMTPVPPYYSAEGLTRISEHYARTQQEVEAVLHNYPSRSSYVDLAGG